MPSNVIANWCLRNFDKTIVDGWNPVYFGRYVDDVLIVDKIAHNSDIYNKAKENKVTGEDIIHFFLQQCSKWKGIERNKCGNNCEFALLKELSEKSKEKQYVLNKRYNPREDDNSKIVVQNNKVKIFYFKSGETDALIRCFRENIEKNKSEFRHMPEDENVFQKGDYKEIYNLKNSETINKFRGIEGVSIDKFELSKFIGKHLRIDGMVEDKKESNFEKEISKIFNIRVIIENYTMWEKIIEIFVINERFEVLKTFVQNILKAIDSVTYVNHYTTTTDKLKEGLHSYLESAIYRPFALVWGAKYHSIIEDIGKLIFEKIKFDPEDLIFLLFQSKRKAYCSTRMIDKSVMPVFIDMLETDELFTDKTNVNLTKFSEVINIVKKKFDNEYLFYPYILTMYDISMISCIEQFQEEQPFYDIRKMHVNQMEYYIHRNYLCLNNRVEEEINNFVKIEEIKDVPKGFRVEVGKNKKNKLKIAIANVKLSYNNFELLMRDNPNRSYQRYMEISKIVNQAIDEHVDMLIMPESFAPYEWLNTLARTCARNKLAVVTGVEYVKFCGRIFNLTAVILPYDDLNYRSAFISFHLKTHYAPAEKQAINGYRFEAVEGEFYELYKWNSCYFPVYCCYELTSINDRALFQSYADFLVAIEWNKDVKYYSNILESLSRDIHCYCIQVNSSNYGDSRITSPSKTEEKDIIRTKGGINSTILVGEIDIFKLRNFQIKGYELQKQSKEFKTVPPGFDCDFVLSKIKESQNG